MLTRVAVPALGPNLAAALRMVMATITLALIMRALRQPWPFAHWRKLFFLGFVGVAGPHILYARSALDLPAAYSALLCVTSVLFGAFASSLLKEEKLTPSKLLGCVLGLLGAALLVRLGPVEPTSALMTAAVLCIAGSALSGVSTPFLKRATTRLEPLAITAGMHAAAVVLMIPGALSDWPTAQFTTPAVASVAVMGIATSGLAYWMYLRIMRYIPPMAALSSTFMSTGFGVVWAVVFLNEPTSPAMAAGGALMLAACLLVFGLNPLRWSGLTLSDKT